MSAATTDCTQVILVPFHANAPSDKQGPVYSMLASALEIPKSSPGFKRSYWGSRLEDQILHIHIVRDTLANSKEWLDSASYQKFLGAIKPLSMGAIAIRHAYLHEYNAGCKALARGSPFTGTAYYLAPDRKAWDLAWARWQTIISKVPGFMGISGGPVVEEVDGHATSFLVFVGWESVEAHDAYHHTEEFRRLRGVLIGPTKGYAYYGHVKFQNEETGDLRSEVKVKEAKL